MQNQIMNKEWYNKTEILELYPMGITTYKRRIRKLSNPIFSNYTRMVLKKLDNSNLKYIEVREIHRDILNELFDDIRVPSQKNKKSIIKWVNNNKWDWFGDIVPSKTRPSELKNKMNFLYNQLKREFGVDRNLIIFYSIEQNKKDKYFHAHFLIKDHNQLLGEKIINEKLELVCEPNTAREKRIFLEEYDYETFGKRGSDYTLKRLEYGYEILK